MSRPDTSPCPAPSDAGYRRHLYRWEWPCQPCVDAHNTYERARAAAAPAALRELVPCGTPSAYRRHKRRGETPCEACRRAHCASVQAYQRRERVS